MIIMGGGCREHPPYGPPSRECRWLLPITGDEDAQVNQINPGGLIATAHNDSLDDVGWWPSRISPWMPP